jgi:bacillithiol system protein YtxJ
MNWIPLTTEEEVKNIKASDEYAIIYKHSTRCMVSLMAFKKLKSETTGGYEVPLYMVDVIKDRAVSMSVADAFSVEHESPQVLLVKNGECVYDASHESVSLKPMLEYFG